MGLMTLFIVLKIEGPHTMIESVWDSLPKANSAMTEYRKVIGGVKGEHYIITRELNQLKKLL